MEIRISRVYKGEDRLGQLWTKSRFSTFPQHVIKITINIYIKIIKRYISLANFPPKTSILRDSGKTKRVGKRYFVDEFMIILWKTFPGIVGFLLIGFFLSLLVVVTPGCASWLSACLRLCSPAHVVGLPPAGLPAGELLKKFDQNF